MFERSKSSDKVQLMPVEVKEPDVQVKEEVN